jgi:hypothetical protein
MRTEGSSRRFRVLALISIVALPTALLALLFGGERYENCLSLYTCPVIPLPTPPIIGTTAGMGAVVLVCLAAWISSTAGIIGHVLENDRRRLVRVAVAMAVSSIALGPIGFLMGVERGHRLREGAEEAAWGVGAAALITLVLGLAWAAWESSRSPITADSESGG